MPGSAEAAIVFLVVVVPGFVYLGGYRLGRAVPEHREGIATVAKVITISAVIAAIAWKLGGRDLYDDVRADTALTSDEGDTWRFVVAILAIPGIIGFLAGEFVDEAARRVGIAQDRRRDVEDSDETASTSGPASRIKRKVLGVLSARLLHEGPTTWDRTWRHLRRTEPYVFVRVTTKSGQELIGAMSNRSRVALTPQPRDIYINEIHRRADDGNYYPTAYGLGAFVSGADIESIEWVSHEGLITVPEARDE
jgi:Family of unknown function (DUF6338)